MRLIIQDIETMTDRAVEDMQKELRPSLKVAPQGSLVWDLNRELLDELGRREFARGAVMQKWIASVLAKRAVSRPVSS